MRYRECDLCGASLDPGEKCTCREEAAEERRKAESKRRASVTAMLTKKAPKGKKKRP